MRCGPPVQQDLPAAPMRSIQLGPVALSCRIENRLAFGTGHR
jgi:hypothetical protein